MYKNNVDFVKAYTDVLEKYWILYKENKPLSYIKVELKELNLKAIQLFPSFVKDEEYLNTMKGRLYVKNPIFYEDFSSYEKYGDKNMYFVDGEWKIYKQKQDMDKLVIKKWIESKFVEVAQYYLSDVC